MELGFGRADQYVSGDRFEIQKNYDFKLGKVRCPSASWDTCDFVTDADSIRCYTNDDDVFLSCLEEEGKPLFQDFHCTMHIAHTLNSHNLCVN